MENAQLINLSRQVSLRRQLDVVANNVANINTSGFKAEKILFEEYKMPVARHHHFPSMDKKLSYTQDWASLDDFSQGTLTQTGGEYDVAIRGKGFFVVETAEGERYTRSGAFNLNPDGELVDLNGNRVQGEAGGITFAPQETDVVIASDGTVSSSAGIKGRLRIVEFQDPQAVKRVGDTMFSGENPQPALQSTVQQGFIEKSNVSGVLEISELIRITRAYTTIAQMISKTDDLRKSAIERLGNLQA